MRRIAFALMVAGCAAALAAGALGLAGWMGQAGAAHIQSNDDGQRDTLGAYTLLSFPSHNKDFIVRDGASGANLLLGPARLEWSSFPGAKGNSIIAAHRDTHFRMLKDVRRGELITLERGGRVYEYRIADLEIVRATDKRFYQQTSDAVLTLVTCYPFYYFGPAPKRFIVRAELLDTKS